MAVEHDGTEACTDAWASRIHSAHPRSVRVVLAALGAAHTRQRSEIPTQATHDAGGRAISTRSGRRCGSPMCS